ncbi:MAG: DUF554 domain-containing protein [Clostridia bacterium]|nr:DUF554 domain-containing protein [Clostridia bacterium]
MLGVIVNTVAVLVGGLIGCFLKKGFPKRVSDAIMTGLGLCVLYVGLDGMFEGNNPLILIIAVAIGAAVGTAFDIDGHINRAAHAVEAKFRKAGEGPSLADGMVAGSLLFCVGAMTVVGSLNAGFGDHTMLFTKSMLDFVAAIMLTVSYGVGVILSAFTVLVLQGAIALLAVFIRPYMGDGLVAELTCTGSLMIVAIGLNMAGITKIKVADFLPALLLVPILYWLFGLVPGLF